MLKFKFAKLVRDKIIEHQLASGAVPHVRQLSPDEHKRELVQKIIEEAQELNAAAPADVAAELADVQQALDDLCVLYDLHRSDVIAAQRAKKALNGTFKKGLYVDYVEIRPDDTKWLHYYRRHPDRYPEL